MTAFDSMVRAGGRRECAQTRKTRAEVSDFIEGPNSKVDDQQICKQYHSKVGGRSGCDA